MRIASFETAEEAESARREREAAARAAVNPFAGTLTPPADQSSMPEGVLCDWLQDQGIEPPAPHRTTHRRDWVKWWDVGQKHWTEEQRATVWQALDKVQFFRVVQRPKRPVVYAVVRVVWGYNDEWYYPGAEGGQTLTVYRSRKRAEAECRDMNEEAREEWNELFEENPDLGYEPAGLNQFDPEDRLLPGQDPFGPVPKPANDVDEEGDELGTFTADEMPYFEVVELDLEGQP